MCPPNAKFISAFPKAKESAVRLQRLAALGIPGDRCATVIHPAAVIAEGVELGTGSFVGACAVIEPEALSAAGTFVFAAEATSVMTFDWANLRSSDLMPLSWEDVPSAKAHTSAPTRYVGKKSRSVDMQL
jgi:hypothetical protein